jgi:ribosomal protein S27AE
MTMTCKDCLHYEVCVIVEHSTGEDEDYLTEFGCDDFKDRTKWAEQKHGRWETDKEDVEWGNSLKRKHCTNCGKRPHFDKEKREFVLSDFCPNCGAKMDEEKERH